MKNSFRDDNIDIDNEKYKLRVYIEEQRIVFDLEFIPISKKLIRKKYIEKFNKSDLETFDVTFKLIKLGEIFDEIYEKLEGKKYTINRNENLKEFIIKKIEIKV